MSGRKRQADRSGPGRRTRRSDDALRLRIIGGRFRGRKLHHSGQPRTRPMKHRVREAIFNLLGPAVQEKHAVDLFAGTGALALEALSRGARRATMIEQHYPTADTIRRNVAVLGVEHCTQIVTANVFVWCRRQPDLGRDPWLVFCSPPYDFYTTRKHEMLELVGGLVGRAPAESLFAVEADERFDFGALPDPEAWDVRRYPPAVVGVYVV